MKESALVHVEKPGIRTEGKSIVVVLGMHRSGTSAITRGLMVLGVELGDNLMPPAPDNNKGFFEDVDVNAINVELYKSLGHGQDWHTLAFVPVAELLHEKNAPLRLRAIELLRSRLQTTDCFGLKDPRICRILPFWQSIFEYLQLKVSYIIAVRNPLSVARSLSKRNNLPPEKCHYLWLEHVLPSILLTQGSPRILVDYDLLLKDPQKQITRIALALDLDTKLDPIRLTEFSQNFLDNELRHATFEPEDVFQDPTVPSLVRTAVTLFSDVVTDKLSVDSEEVAKVFENLSEQMEGMSQAMSYLLQLDNIIASANRALVDRDTHIGSLNQSIAMREAQVTTLTQTVHDRDTHILSLDQALVGRDGRIEALMQAAEEHETQVAVLTQTMHDKDAQLSSLDQVVAERDGWIEALMQAAEEHETQIAVLTQTMHDKDAQLSSLDQVVAGRDGRIEGLMQAAEEHETQIAVLTQTMHDKDAQLSSLDQVIAERDGRIEALMQAAERRDAQMAALTQAVHDKDAKISNLDQVATERDGRIEALMQVSIQKDITLQQLQVSTIQLNHRLAQTHTSLGWKFLKPVRIIRKSLTHFSQWVAVDLVPLSQLRRNGIEWSLTGNDAQFLLMAKRPWNALTGWYWLDVYMIAERACKARLHFDSEREFAPTNVINISFSGKDSQRIPLFISRKCCAIRLELCDQPRTFKFSILALNKLKEAPELPEEFLAQSSTYEALGGREGNGSSLAPLNDIQRYAGIDYCWLSRGGDPWFALENIGKSLRSGWYMIELRIRLNADHGRAKVYFDYGAGYSESNSLTVPFTNGNVVRRVFYLPAHPKFARFDPVEAAASFSVERFHYTQVPPKVARRRMLKYLCSHYTRHKGQTVEQAWRDLQVLAKARGIPAETVLYQRYDESFSAERLYNPISYAEWIERFETPVFSDLPSIETMRKTFKHEPAISIIMPVYNTAEIFLRQAIDSVLAQSYPHWELCIADDASRKLHIRKVLEEYAQHDTRIKIMFREKNEHISATSNSALQLATGEYVALMDHDDELARHALLFMVEAINRNPSAQILYSDEDKIDELGNRSDPHFKPDWNPDLFFSQNYISHLGIYRRELLCHIGGFRIGVEGSQDQDLLLRCLPHVKPVEIVHVSKVLYHWRMMEGSTALASGEKSYTTEAGIKALRDFFEAQGQNDIKVECGLEPNTYRVRYPLPQPEPLVSLLIPTRDMLEMLEPCIRSILEGTTYQNYEIIILDNESAQSATLDYFKYIQAEDARVRVLPYQHPFNYSAINNYGVKYAKGELIGLVNNDTKIINQEWLAEMASHASRPEIGCVGAKLYYEDESIQHAGVIVGIGGVAGHSHKYFPRTASGYFSRLKIVQNLSAVTAACLVVRKSVYEQVGGLDETGLRVAFNDIDFCLKVREAGYRNLWTPYAELYHYESKTRGTEDTSEKKMRFNGEVDFIKTKWGEVLRRDPFYSENLTLTREDFSIGS